MNFAIQTFDLGKSYGTVKAVEHLSLQVAEGEIYAFLGLNGAGKTTTIRMLLGMVKPNNGYVKVLDTRIRPGKVKPWADVGYMVEDPRAYPELTVFENLEAARRLHPGTPRQAVGEVIERLGLEAYAVRPAGTLSHGNAQRLGIAKALIHKPKLLILDEPANGLDPAGIIEIRQLLQQLTAEQGGTVFMSSHILAEVSKLAGRIGIIHKGHLLQEMDIESLEKNRKRRLLLRARDLKLAQQKLAEKGQAAEMLADGTIEIREAAAADHPDEINRMMMEAGIPLTQLLVEEEELEQYFLRLIHMEGEKKHE